ncbi:hypothetical protein [Deinococcus carri]|uniref:hypothetical protein n=1 Tax=Deinococcus carri TaxID=1211323 RepID=UPI0031EE0B61
MKKILLGLLALSATAHALETTYTQGVEKELAAYKVDGPNLCDRYAEALGSTFDSYTRGYSFAAPRYMAELLVQNRINANAPLALDGALKPLSDESSQYRLIEETKKEVSVWFFFNQRNLDKTDFCFVAFKRK